MHTKLLLLAKKITANEEKNAHLLIITQLK